MFDFIKTYIHNFFKLYPRIYEEFEDYTDHPWVPILHPDFNYTPKLFFQTVCDAHPDSRTQYYVRQLIWYKETSDSYHEFILAELSDSSTLLVERRLSGGAEPRLVISTSLPSPSNSTTVTFDTVYGITKSSSALTTRLASCPAEPVGQYSFKDFPLIEFARLLVVISQQKPHCVIDKTMCYWFASSIVGIARKEFGDDTIDPTTPFLAGSWELYKFKVNVKELEAIREIYVQERARDPDPIGPREAKWRQELNEIKANTDQMVKEIQANRKQIAEEKRKQIKELQQMTEEERKQIKELQQMAEEKQKQIEELQRALEIANSRADQ